MSCRKTRGALMACVVALTLAGAPARSDGCEALDWIWPWNWCRGAASATTYQPAYIAPSCAPVQTCSYVPETAYRAVSRVVPTTTCMPVTYCDPCTGCPVTCYRPMTSLVRTTQLIPYTTYRTVWSNPCASYVGGCGTGSAAPCSTGCATGCGTSSGGSYAPMSGTYATPTPGCSSCGTAATPSPTTTFLAPPMTTPAPAPPLPEPAASPSAAPKKTFQNGEPAAKAPLSPIPDSDIQQNSYKKPQIIEPGNRTTARPILQAGYVEPASAPAAIDYGGWRASRN
jgi:hypothetical protein